MLQRTIFTIYEHALRRTVSLIYSIFVLSWITCSEAHKSSGHQHVVLVIFTGQVYICIVDIGWEVDEDRAHQRLPTGPVVGPETKNGWGHHLTNAVGRHDPSQEAGISAVINLWDTNMWHNAKIALFCFSAVLIAYLKCEYVRMIINVCIYSAHLPNFLFNLLRFLLKLKKKCLRLPTTLWEKAIHTNLLQIWPQWCDDNSEP